WVSTAWARLCLCGSRMIAASSLASMTLRAAASVLPLRVAPTFRTLHRIISSRRRVRAGTFAWPAPVLREVRSHPSWHSRAHGACCRNAVLRRSEVLHGLAVADGWRFPLACAAPRRPGVRVRLALVGPLHRLLSRIEFFGLVLVPKCGGAPVA